MDSIIRLYIINNINYESQFATKFKIFKYMYIKEKKSTRITTSTREIRATTYL